MEYKRILVGTDGSATAEKAVEAAASIARQLNAELHVLSAYRSTSAISAGLGAVVATSDLDDGQLQEFCQQTVDSSIASWGHGLTTRGHVVSGIVADTIVGAADSVGADLIVVGNKGMHGARRVLGSVPNSVAHNANCDVLIFKTD